MKKLCCALLAAATLALCGCGSFLERTYSSSQPHSATYYESDGPLCPACGGVSGTS